ncbi:MAG TPA: hypothetical protein VGN16_24630 [Acidobacteriaceae bacterium]|jgi:hypothetical protein
MDKIPFSVYDTLAILSCGMVVLAAGDYIVGSDIVLRKDGIPANITILLIFAAYILGQIIANIALTVYEGMLVRRFLRPPAVRLMADASTLSPMRWVFPGYFQPLPPETQAHIRTQAAARNCTAAGEGLFLHCYAIATANIDKLQARLDEFRNQYGFSRNVSCALFLAGFGILAGHHLHPERVHLRWAIAAFLAAIGLLYRYLRFFRQYSYELLLRYSELAAAK